MREVAKACYTGNFRQVESSLPEVLIPGRKANYRCCVYMERAIMAERIKIIRGGEPEDFNIIDVISIACDQCPMGGYTVTESCRSCIGHACKQACPKGAISIDAHHHAHIDKEKCVNCGLCAKACPFGAIYNFRRPCQKACPVGAITMDENLSAKIDYSKCITCGNCTQKCPFGAISDKTFMTFVIDHIRNNILATKKRPIYAIVAPSIVAQFPRFKIEQIYEGIINLGFTNICEAALGADIVAMQETKELIAKKVLTSSCCPAFVDYILKFHPELKDKVSEALSPMAETAKQIKKLHPNALTVFIGPCTCKKMERCKPNIRPYVDYVLTFVELRAMFAARDIDLNEYKGISMDDASGYARNFARSGGVNDAVSRAIRELDIKNFKLTSLSCNGMRDCIKALENLSTGVSPYNYIEGMACEGGCVCGPGSLNQSPAVGKAYVQNHARMAGHKTILESAKRYDPSLKDVQIKIEKIIPKVTVSTQPVSYSNFGKPSIPFEEYRKSVMKRDKSMSASSIFAKSLEQQSKNKNKETTKMPIEPANKTETTQGTTDTTKPTSVTPTPVAVNTPTSTTAPTPAAKPAPAPTPTAAPAPAPTPAPAPVAKPAPAPAPAPASKPTPVSSTNATTPSAASATTNNPSLDKPVSPDATINNLHPENQEKESKEEEKEPPLPPLK